MEKKFLLIGAVFAIIFMVASAYNVDPCTHCPPCAPPRPCRFGEELDFCHCCGRCLKGEGEKCGGPDGTYGKCAKDLFCEKEEDTPSSPKVCTSFDVQCLVPCDFQPCGPEPSCKYGSTTDSCGCCKLCLPGIGEPCGGRCGTGLYCDESTSEGICKPRLPIGGSPAGQVIKFPS